MCLSRSLISQFAAEAGAGIVAGARARAGARAGAIAGAVAQAEAGFARFASKTFDISLKFMDVCDFGASQAKRAQIARIYNNKKRT